MQPFQQLYTLVKEGTTEDNTLTPLPSGTFLAYHQDQTLYVKKQPKNNILLTYFTPPRVGAPSYWEYDDWSNLLGNG